MASKAPKVRLVRCPKCFKLLPELATLPVYQCGGCGITLKAKLRMEVQEGESSATLHQNSAQSRELEHGCENDKELTSSSQKATVSSSDGCEQIEYQEKSSSGRVSNRSASSSEPELNGNDESLSIEGNIRPDGHHEIGSDLETPHPDDIQNISGGSNLTTASPKLFTANVSSKLNASPLKEELEESEMIVRRYADLIGARGAAKTAEATDNSVISEDDMVGVSKAPTTKSFHAYDDSVISEDDMVGVSKAPTTKSFHAYDDSVISEDDMVGVSKAPTTKSFHAYDDSVISEDDMVGVSKPPTAKSFHAHDASISSNDGVSKPPTTKSFHAYDASISSNDGWGDQVSNIHSQLSKRSSFGSEKLPELVDPNGGSTREDVSVSNRIAVNSELHNQAKKFSLMSVNEKHDPVSVESASLGQDGLTENTRYGIEDQKQVHSRDSAIHSPAQSWLEVGRQELKHEKRLGQQDFSAGYENKDPSKYRRKNLIGSCLYSPENIKSVERNQMELLRKVDELRDQLNRSCDINGKANERFTAKGKQQERSLPLYYNHQNLPDHDMLQYRDVNLPRRSPGRYVPTNPLPFQCGYSKPTPSGNVMNCRHHANCLCLNAYKEDWQYPQQLPPNICYNEVLSRPYPDHVYYNLYGSSSSSPEPHLHSRYPLQCRDADMLPYNHIDKDRDLENLHRKERRQCVKKHCRPMAGGSPLIVCYHCQKLLYLPADAFVSNKRWHRLQCGSCFEVLTFSLHKGTRLAPYPQNLAVPSQHEVYDSSASTSLRNSVDTFNGNDNHQISYTEDYGRSTFKSVSTESEIKEVSRKQVSNRRNGTAKKSGNKQKKVMHASDSDIPTSDASRLHKELLQMVTGPTLHQLMGYSSPSRVLYGSSE